MLINDRYRCAARLVAVVALVMTAELPQLALGQAAGIDSQAEKLLQAATAFVVVQP